VTSHTERREPDPDLKQDCRSRKEFPQSDSGGGAGLLQTNQRNKYFTFRQRGEGENHLKRDEKKGGAVTKKPRLRRQKRWEGIVFAKEGGEKSELSVHTKITEVKVQLTHEQKWREIYRGSEASASQSHLIRVWKIGGNPD